MTEDRLPVDPVIVWSLDLQSVDVQPIIYSGTVYVLAGNGTLWALDEVTGEAIWKSQMDGRTFQTSTPACDGERIYAATDSGNLAAFDAQTGRTIWTHHLTDMRFECPVTYADGNIYLGEGIGYGKQLKRYFSFDPEGNECWNVTRETNGYLWDGACVAGDFVVYGDNDGVLLSVNRTDGTVVDVLDLRDGSRISFAKEDAGRIRASVSYGDGYVYTSSEFSLEIGYAWKIGFDETAGLFEDDGWGTAVGFSTSTPAVYRGRVYLGVGEHGQPGELVCLDDSSGDAIWSYPLDGGVKSSPALSEDGERVRICIVTAKTNTSAYCIEDAGDEGQMVWTFNPPDGGYIVGSVAISDGSVYLGTENGILYRLSDETEIGNDEVDEANGWPQFHNGPTHTGATDSSAPVTNETAWISEDIGAVEGTSVSVAGGKVFVNCNSQLVCLDEFSGEVLWNATFEPNPYGSWSTPVYDDGKVFFSNWGTFCLDAADGSEIWSFVPPTALAVVDGSPVVAENKVIVSDWDGHHYYCLDEKTGDELWNFSVGGGCAQSTPAVFAERVVFGSWEWNSAIGGRIYCVNLGDGREIWNISTDDHPCGSAAISDGCVYMTSYNFYGDGNLYAISLENGSVIWNQRVQRTDSTPTVAEGKVYVSGGCDGFSDLQTYCFDAATGDLVWMTEGVEKLGEWRCSLACAGDMVFVGKIDFETFVGTYALNATSGEQIWFYPAGGSSPAVADGMVFTTGGGRVYAFGQPGAHILSLDEMGGDKNE